MSFASSRFSASTKFVCKKKNSFINGSQSPRIAKISEDDQKISFGNPGNQLSLICEFGISCRFGSVRVRVRHRWTSTRVSRMQHKGI